jgi:hypothetical protein
VKSDREIPGVENTFPTLMADTLHVTLDIEATSWRVQQLPG